MIIYRTAGCPVFSIVINMEPRRPLALEMIVREKERERERGASTQIQSTAALVNGVRRPSAAIFSIIFATRKNADVAATISYARVCVIVLEVLLRGLLFTIQL